MYSTQKNVISGDFDINNLLVPSIGQGTLNKELCRGGMRLNGQQKKKRTDIPLVSIVTSVFNRDSFIEKSMCSVFDQDYENIELIIVDGASTDSTMDVVKKYSDVIDFYISAPDTGIYEGMNRAISFSSGDYILILNSDDWYAQNAVGLLLSKLLNSGDKDGFASALAYGVDNNYHTRRIPPMEFNARSLFRMQLRHETMLISREIYQKFGLYDTNYSIIGDSQFTSKLFKGKCNHVRLHEYIMFFRESGVSANISEVLLQERGKMIKENFPFLREEVIDLLSNNISSKNKKKYQQMRKDYNEYTYFLDALNVFLEGKY